MPVPSGPVTVGSGWLVYTGAFDVRWEGRHGKRVDAAVARFTHDMRVLAGPGPWPQHAIPLSIHCCTAGSNLMPATLGGQPEAYVLTVTNKGVDIQAKSGLGLLHAMATLRQMLQRHQGSWALKATTIHDQPRFHWRGVMIDTARHFMSITTLKRQIDAMALVKLNVLHLHLSDKQGFRVQSRVFPKLTAHEHGQFYTQDQICELVDYAAGRGIRIVPEFDVPGHAGAITRAYPQYAPQGKAGAGVLDIANPKTYVFVRKLFTEMAELFPDPEFHVGGDEVKGKAWKADHSIQAFMRAHDLKDVHALQGWFERHVQHIVHDLGKRMVGWEEVGSMGLSESVTVQAWNSSNAVYAATKAGHPVIVSAGYYLNYIEPASVYYLRDPLDATAAGVDPAIYAKVQKIGNPELSAVFPKSHVIRPGLKFSAAQKRLIKGGEAALWSELVTDELLGSRLWPRLAALAERFWSPADIRDVAGMQARLVTTQAELERLGLAARANRWRMAVRLAPRHPDVVMRLADITTPVRNFAHMHQLLAYVHKQAFTSQSFWSLTDIAKPSNPVALTFNLAASRFAAGDHSHAAALMARMRGWKDNDSRFRKLATSNAQLEAARPVSADTAKLADIGMQAVACLRKDCTADAEWWAKAQSLLARLAQQEQASSSLFATIISPKQPPADLLIAVLPGVQALVQAVDH